MAKFNLLTEPWIPVFQGGRVREVGLAEALLEAHTIARIETPSPLEEVALHRLLLAVLYRALPPLRGGCDALELLEQGGFDRNALQKYLCHYRDRFYLFHDTAPFLQIPDLPDKDPLPWAKLLPEMASGNNPTLFDHTTEENVPLASYAQAARALLVHQAYAPGGLLKRLGVTSARDAPLARPAAFLAVGENLFQTLVLNLVPQKDPGMPVWELPPLRTQDVQGHATKWPLEGAARVYAWPSRGVLLLDEGNGVREMAYGPGVEPLEVGFRDPMVAYRLGGEGQVLPLRLSVEKSFWRDFSAMLPAAGGSFPATLAHAVRVAEEMGLRLELRVLGQVSDQAKVLDVRREVYPLPQGFLSPVAEELLQKALELAERVGNALYGVAREVAMGVLGDKDQEELRRFQDSLPLLRLYWAALDGRFPRFLEGLAQPDAMDRWREEVRQAALRAWEETRAFVGTEGRHLKGLAVGERAMGLALTHAQAREGRP
ncbi:type I-E CRISPR-associated protein Cse1/CasA [Thermus tengchongensis]|uniref:Type I-E CRISPR-associated protein Cse1/CasA n=1 Tax=Thermus tengchongensis TaxID=1214928 RepID=A0A4Y9FBD2_9DEIN|nr:type I-E CRISPR-associated protein Cse1/CasA [Thermus tengchongensis]TFU26514.1 type I-E CRISPR-associated protein Cse1/CasA [Thermus tengchongensis]